MATWVVTPGLILRWVLLFAAWRWLSRSSGEPDGELGRVPVFPPLIFAGILMLGEMITIIIGDWLEWLPPGIQRLERDVVIVRSELSPLWLLPLFALTVTLTNWLCAFRAGWSRVSVGLAAVFAVDVVLNQFWPTLVRFPLLTL